MTIKSTVARFGAVMAGGLMLSAAFGANAAVIFGTDGGGSVPSTLYSINSTTGMATAIGAGLGFLGVSAMDFDPLSGTLYGIGRVGGGDQRLFTVNTATGVGTSVADIPDGHSFGSKYSGMSFRSDGSLFVYLEGGDGLGTLNIGTGALTELGPSGVSCCGNGIGFNAGDVLHHANEDDLSTLNQATGFATTVPGLVYPSGGRINAMDFEAATGMMFVSINRGGGGGPNFLGTINLTTAVLSIIGLSVPGLDAITVQNGAVAPVPEPATLALFGLGLAGLGLARRRRKPAA